MDVQETFLTDEQQGRLDQTKKWKKGDAWITPKKMVMKEGQEFTGEFIEVKPVKRSSGNFDTFIFKDFVFGDFVYLTGTNLVQYHKEVEFKKGNFYNIIFNGMSKTAEDRPFKSFTIVNVTPEVKFK